jgi:hypothetical protein
MALPAVLAGEMVTELMAGNAEGVIATPAAFETPL